jgi:hypothetical protein
MINPALKAFERNGTGSTNKLISLNIYHRRNLDGKCGSGIAKFPPSAGVGNINEMAVQKGQPFSLNY